MSVNSSTTLKGAGAGGSDGRVEGVSVVGVGDGATAVETVETGV